MTTDIKRQIKTTGATVAVIAAALSGGLYLADKKIAAVLAPAPKTITISWDAAPIDHPGTVTEVWATTNLVVISPDGWNFTWGPADTGWQLRTNVTGTNAVTLPRDKPAEFFKVRFKTPHWFKHGTNAAVTNWHFTDWSRKPTL